MAYTTITKQETFFKTLLYTGNGASSRSLTGVGFQPDWIWIKDRSTGHDHYSFQSPFTTKYGLEPSDTSGERNPQLGSFDSDGFTFSSLDSFYNSNSDNYVSWNWKAGTTSGLSGGTITPTAYSFNATSGFGMYVYNGTGSNANIAHGLGRVPHMVMVKRIDQDGNSWQVYHKNNGANQWMELDNSTAQQSNTNRWNGTAPTSSIFYIGTDSDVNASGGRYIAYVFAPIPGYSRIGAYRGQAGAGGQTPFIYTGFKPSWIMIKKANGTQNWRMFDSARDIDNPMEHQLKADTSDTESTGTSFINFVSNGFKILVSTDSINGNNGDYIYLCFGQSVVGSNNVPATAR
jgi:hypothetical protein